MRAAVLLPGFLPPTEAAFFGEKRDGDAGAAIEKNLGVKLRREVTVRRVPYVRKTWNDGWRVQRGVNEVEDVAFVVAEVSSPEAAAAGWRVGDKLVSVKFDGLAPVLFEALKAPAPPPGPPRSLFLWNRGWCGCWCMLPEMWIGFVRRICPGETQKK